MKFSTPIKNLVLAIVLVMSFNKNRQSERSMLLIGFTSAPPFIIENRENLEGLSVWLWKRVANDLNKYRWNFLRC